MSGEDRDAPFRVLGRPRDLPALRTAFPEWEFTADLAKVTAVLRDDRSVSATHGPVSVAVMANVLDAWKVARDRHVRSV